MFEMNFYLQFYKVTHNSTVVGMYAKTIIWYYSCEKFIGQVWFGQLVNQSCKRNQRRNGNQSHWVVPVYEKCLSFTYNN